MYEVGDKVRIINERGVSWALDGAMDKWMGKEMTICEIYGNSYKMVEDAAENGGHGWFWQRKDFVPVVEKKPNFFEEVHKMIDDAMAKKDRYVTLYFGESGTSVSVYPITDEKEEE